MVKISNNVLAALLLLAIVISSAGLLSLVSIPVLQITGAASIGAGLTNLSVTSQVSIKMLRNLTDFGASTVPPSTKTWISTTQNNTNATQSTSFNNGSEGNGTNYGTGTFVYPFVIENDGNDNTTCINISAGSTPTVFIGGSSWGGPSFNAMETDNETASGVSCSGNKASSWMPLNASAVGVIICQEMHSDNTTDEIRVHFQLGIPDDAAPGTNKNNVITIAAWNTC